MKLHFRLLILFILLALISTASAQQSPEPTQTNARSFPYFAEIIGEDVYIRSGPGTNYYDCGKLKKGNKVKVVGTQHGWSRIVPPETSFSWISKQYVDTDPNNPNVGVVTGNAVRVYAGSEHVQPLYSTTLQGKLNRQEKVRLLSEEKGGYLKIAPPAFAYLWVSSKYAKPIDIPSPPTKEPEEPVKKTTLETKFPAVVSPDISTTTEKLKKYYDLQKQIKDERDKSIRQQNYNNFKKTLQKLADDDEAGKAARYAQFSLKQIERYELALNVEKQLQFQQQQLQRIKQQIENVYQKKLAQTPDLGKFDVIGTLVNSGVYNTEKQQKHFRLIDDFGKTVCYALPTGPAEKVDTAKLTGKKVGLIGKILPHPQSAGALIEFTDITVLK